MKRAVLLIVFLFLLVFSNNGNAVTLDFEDLSNLEFVTNQYAGLTFTNTITLTAGISLNEFDFPPVSGENVVSDDFGLMGISFDDPVESLWGYFTYLAPLTLSFYDSSDVLINTVISNFSDNTVFSGNAPNELLGLDYALGISRVEILGDDWGSSFTLDNLSFQPINSSSPVPEPATVLLFGGGLLIGFINKGKNKYA